MATSTVCTELGHRFVLRKAKMPRELSPDDQMIIMVLLMSIIGAPLIFLYLWFRSSTTCTYEICERCGTKL